MRSWAANIKSSAKLRERRKKLGAKFLRTVGTSKTGSQQSETGSREYACARHVVSEIARVVAGERACATATTSSSAIQFKATKARAIISRTAPGIGHPRELARKAPHSGARLTGGGFGGATINLVTHHQAADFMDFMSREYRNEPASDDPDGLPDRGRRRVKRTGASL